MFASPSHKVVFLAIPKTSTRTMYDVLAKHFGGKLIKEHSLLIPKHLKSYTSFIVARNPYDRFISLWWSTCKRPGDKRGFVKRSGGSDVILFARFLKQYPQPIGGKLFTKQVEYYKPNRVDYIIRFEHLEEDFNKLPFVKEQIQLPTLNPTKDKRETWLHYYDQELLDYVNNCYQADFDRLDYPQPETMKELHELYA